MGPSTPIRAKAFASRANVSRRLRLRDACAPAYDEESAMDLNQLYYEYQVFRVRAERARSPYLEREC